MTAWRARLVVLRSEHTGANSAVSAKSPDGSPNGAFGIRVETPRQATEVGADRARHDRVAFLLRAAEEAEATLRATDLGLDAERAMLASYYAEREAEPPPDAYRFPCGKLVKLKDRTWSNARGWCCPSCHSAEAANGR